MNLNEFAAKLRLSTLEDLTAGRAPSVGEYSETALREAHSKGRPQLGATRFEPNSVLIEFIYPDPKSSAAVLTVTVPTPERVVFMPVPEWVVESIWQGEIDGSFQFESEAMGMLSKFEAMLSDENNPALFGPKAPTKRS